ncbi:hypothetical protein BDV28DRAFT_139080 [Aspergillus coremiiformis]|uniref:Uncharacterized protein n=1 Tax=Aspergillus coremiiformis TaxID=138285 RepID=A0A5N6YZV2_9EURO|nr:hypothetical protein BDV28DRAFT_139080 [Aspergillus coremiiformis]
MNLSYLLLIGAASIAQATVVPPSATAECARLAATHYRADELVKPADLPEGAKRPRGPENYWGWSDSLPSWFPDMDTWSKWSDIRSRLFSERSSEDREF